MLTYSLFSKLKKRGSDVDHGGGSLIVSVAVIKVKTVIALLRVLHRCLVASLNTVYTFCTYHVPRVVISGLVSCCGMNPARVSRCGGFNELVFGYNKANWAVLFIVCGML